MATEKWYQGQIDRPSVWTAIGDLRAQAKASSVQMGRWIYVLNPDSPGSEWEPGIKPADWPETGVDPLSPPWQNGWLNPDGAVPFAFRMFPATKVKMRGAFYGGTIPSILFRLPGLNYPPVPMGQPENTVNFWPPADLPFLFTSTDGGTIYSGKVTADGYVWILKQF